MNLITKKLRDVTSDVNKEWLNKKCEFTTCPKCLFYDVECGDDCHRCWIKHKYFYSDKFLDQTIEIEVPDILTKEEKEYLSAVIKPFRDRVDYIKKVVLPDTDTHLRN